jgi:hypothetical protein
MKKKIKITIEKLKNTTKENIKEKLSIKERNY